MNNEWDNLFADSVFEVVALVWIFAVGTMLEANLDIIVLSANMASEMKVKTSKSNTLIRLKLREDMLNIQTD